LPPEGVPALEPCLSMGRKRDALKSGRGSFQSVDSPLELLAYLRLIGSAKSIARFALGVSDSHVGAEGRLVPDGEAGTFQRKSPRHMTTHQGFALLVDGQRATATDAVRHGKETGHGAVRTPTPAPLSLDFLARFPHSLRTARVISSRSPSAYSGLILSGTAGFTPVAGGSTR